MMGGDHDARVALLGERIQKLQNLRHKVNKPYHTAKSTIDPELPSAQSLGADHAINSIQKSSQFNDNSQAKLKATVKLLSESLDEQGKLRALLEYTVDPALYNQFLEGKEDENDGDGQSDNVSNSSEIRNFNELTLRAAALQQQRLVEQVSDHIPLPYVVRLELCRPRVCFALRVVMKCVTLLLSLPPAILILPLVADRGGAQPIRRSAEGTHTAGKRPGRGTRDVIGAFYYISSLDSRTFSVCASSTYLLTRLYHGSSGGTSGMRRNKRRTISYQDKRNHWYECAKQQCFTSR